MLGLEQIMDSVGEVLVLRIPGQELLELGGRDDGVLMLAQDVLKLGGQADEPLGALSVREPRAGAISSAA